MNVADDITVPWLAVNNHDHEPVTVPSEHMLAEALWDHSSRDIIDLACPWWLRHDLTDLAWAIAPGAIITLGMPQPLMRFYLAVLLAASTWVALRWSHLQHSLERARRQVTSTDLLAIANQIRTTEPALAIDIAVAGNWNPALTKALRANLASRAH